MASVNPLKRTWSEGRTAFGLWAAMPGFLGAEILAGAGVDYVCVDQQHGILDYDSMAPMLGSIHAAGAAPVARVEQNDPGLIGKALDAGALGVIVPLVNSAEDAARAVAACRYPPTGLRSYGPFRAASIIGSTDPDDLAGEVVCLAMVETREALERVDEIAATPGLDGIYIGPADLAMSLGRKPTLEVLEGEHADAVRGIRESCHRHGITAGIHSAAGEVARRHAEAGFDMITVAADSSLLREATLREMRAARAESVDHGTGEKYF